jgi:hypothetical protein
MVNDASTSAKFLSEQCSVSMNQPTCMWYSTFCSNRCTVTVYVYCIVYVSDHDLVGGCRDCWWWW